VGVGILFRHPHWVLAPDPLDRYADASLVILAVLAVAVVMSSVVKWRRGKHRADPAIRAVADRMVQVEKLASGGGPLTDRVAADEARLNQLQQSYIQLVDVIKDVFGEAGRELPWEQPRKPDLHVIKGGGEAV